MNAHNIRLTNFVYQGGDDCVAIKPRSFNIDIQNATCHGGNGISLVMKFTGLPFQEAARRIERVIGETPVQPVRAERSEASRRAALNALQDLAGLLKPGKAKRFSAAGAASRSRISV